MKTVTMNATEARKNFFDILNAAVYGGQVTIIVKNGKEVATIQAKKKKKFDLKKYMKSLNTLHELMTGDDYKDIEKTHKSFKTRFPDW